MIPNDVHMVNADGVVEFDPIVTAHDAGDSDLITYAKATFSLDEKCFFNTEDLATVDALAIFVGSLFEMDGLTIHFTRTFRERKSKMTIQQSFGGVDCWPQSQHNFLDTRDARI